MTRRLSLLAGLAATLLLFSRMSLPAQCPPEGSIRLIDLPMIKIEMREGVGREKVSAYCNICHSLDYITTQPGFSSDRWRAIVNKMIKVYGLRIDEKEAEAVVRYLAQNYGTGR